MGTPSHAEKLRATYQRWHDTKGKSAEDWLALVSDDLKLRSAGDGHEKMAFSAPRNGKADLEAYFAVLAADWDMIHFTMEEIISEGDLVMARGTCEWKNRHTGKSAKSFIIDRIRFHNGLIVEFEEFYDTATAIAAATPDK